MNLTSINAESDSPDSIIGIKDGHPVRVPVRKADSGAQANVAIAELSSLNPPSMVVGGTTYQMPTAAQVAQIGAPVSGAGLVSTNNYASAAALEAAFPAASNDGRLGLVNGALFVSRGSAWAPATPGEFNANTIAYAATVTLDMQALAGTYRTISLTGALTLATSNRAAGRSVTLRLIGDGSARALTFPAGWVFIGSAAPASLAAGKTAILTATFFGTADTDCVAAYGVQP